MPFKLNPLTAKLDYYEKSSGGSPGGSDTELQFNDSGSFGGDSGLTYNKTTKLLTSDNITVPGAGTNSEHFGLGSTAAGNESVAIGGSANASVSEGVAIGYLARAITVSGVNTGAVALGHRAHADAQNALAIGSQTVASGVNSFAFGRAGIASGQGAIALGPAAVASNVASIAISTNANASGATAIAIGNVSTAAGVWGVAIGNGAKADHNGSVCIGLLSISTATNQFVSGDNNSPKSNVFFANGVVSTAPVAWTLNGTGGSGTNIAGGETRIAGGKATGNAVGGAISFQTSDAGSSGAALQSLTTKMTLGANGNVGIGTTPNANAILDVSSTTKAFMPPRMNTTQKEAIASPTAGMVVYDSTLSKLCVYTTAWETITSS